MFNTPYSSGGSYRTIGGDITDSGDQLMDSWNSSSDYQWQYNGGRSKARQRMRREQAYGIGGGFLSGGLPGALSAAGSMFGGPLGGLLGGILGKGLGGLFGGGKHKDLGLTPSNPLYVHDTLMYNAISQTLNILLAQKAQQSSASVTRDFRDVRAQANVTRTAMGVAR